MNIVFVFVYFVSQRSSGARRGPHSIPNPVLYTAFSSSVLITGPVPDSNLAHLGFVSTHRFGYCPRIPLSWTSRWWSLLLHFAAGSAKALLDRLVTRKALVKYVHAQVAILSAAEGSSQLILLMSSSACSQAHRYHFE